MLQSVTSLYALRALVVGSNAQERGVIRSLLHGFKLAGISEAADSNEAAAEIRQKKPDIVISYMALKPLDGPAFAHFLRHAEESPNPYIPILLVMGEINQNRICEARDAGVSAIIVAPVTAQNLQYHLIEIIERPRPFIRTGSYFGPERRVRPRSPEAPEPERLSARN